MSIRQSSRSVSSLFLLPSLCPFPSSRSLSPLPLSLALSSLCLSLPAARLFFLRLLVVLSCELEHRVPNSVIQMQGIYGRAKQGSRRWRRRWRSQRSSAGAGEGERRERLAIKFNAILLTLDPGNNALPTPFLFWVPTVSDLVSDLPATAAAAAATAAATGEHRTASAAAAAAAAVPSTVDRRPGVVRGLAPESDLATRRVDGEGREKTITA